MSRTGRTAISIGGVVAGRRVRRAPGLRFDRSDAWASSATRLSDCDAPVGGDVVLAWSSSLGVRSDENSPPFATDPTSTGSFEVLFVLDALARRRGAGGRGSAGSSVSLISTMVAPQRVTRARHPKPTAYAYSQTPWLGSERRAPTTIPARFAPSTPSRPTGKRADTSGVTLVPQPARQRAPHAARIRQDRNARVGGLRASPVQCLLPPRLRTKREAGVPHWCLPDTMCSACKVAPDSPAQVRFSPFRASQGRLSLALDVATPAAQPLS
jgi:hypothetical protein